MALWTSVSKADASCAGQPAPMRAAGEEVSDQHPRALLAGSCHPHSDLYHAPGNKGWIPGAKAMLSTALPQPHSCGWDGDCLAVQQ